MGGCGTSRFRVGCYGLVALNLGVFFGMECGVLWDELVNYIYKWVTLSLLL